MPTVIEGNIGALSKNGNNIFPITTPRAVIEEGSDRNLLDMLEEATRIPTAEEVGAAKKEMISDAWSATKTYRAGDCCIHNNALWKCLVANTSTPPGGGTTWEETKLTSLLSNVYQKYFLVPIDGFPDNSNTAVDLKPYLPSGAFLVWVEIRHGGTPFPRMNETSTGFSIVREIDSEQCTFMVQTKNFGYNQEATPLRVFATYMLFDPTV